MNKILETIETTNLNVTEIAKFHGTSRNEVIKVLIDNEYFIFKENPNSRLPTAKRLKQAAKLFIDIGCQRTTITDAASKVGVRKTTLKKYIETYYPDVQISRINYNEHVFDSIDTEEKAYWLGFLYADGYLCNSSYSLELQLGNKDLEHVRKFARFINYNGKISQKRNKKDKNEEENYTSYRISITNKHLWNTLNNLGCTPRKSLTLKFPSISIFKSVDLIRHFIRGYFDGDGTLGIYDNKVGKYDYHNHCQLSFLGTKDMLSNIVKHIGIDKEVKLVSLNPKTKNDLFKITYVTREAFKVSFYMYENSTIYLDRKYVKYLEYCRLYEELYKELQTKIGEGCDANPEVITETKESVTP